MSTIIKKQIGVSAVNLRSNSGFTQEELSDKADISTRHLQDLEAAKKMAKVDTVFQLAHALGVDYKKLLQNAWDEWLAEQSSSK